MARYSSTASGLGARGSGLSESYALSKSCDREAASRDPEPRTPEPRTPNQWSNCPVLSPGQVLDDRYEILALLAEGGMGAVYRARRTLLGDEVAIKIVRGEHGGVGSARPVLPRKPSQRAAAPSLHRLDSRLQRGR